MRYLKIATISALICGFYSIAAEATLPLSSGIYTEINAGAGFNGKNFGSHFNTFSQWFGGSLNLGYKINMFLGMEGGVSRYPDATFGNESDTGTMSWDVAAKLIMPFDNGVELFGKIGYANMFQKTSHADDPANNGNHEAGTLMGGAGVSFYGSSHWALTLQAVATKSVKTIPTQYLTTLGVTYIF